MIKFVRAKDTEDFLREIAEDLGKRKGFTVIDKLSEMSVGVYQVENHNGIEVLKIMDSRVKGVPLNGVVLPYDAFGCMRAMRYENMVYNAVGEIDGLPKQFAYYGPPRGGLASPVSRLASKFSSLQVAQLREYIVGTPMGEWTSFGYITKASIPAGDDTLVGVIKAIHEAGFSNLDLISPNIVLSEEGPYLIDLIAKKPYRQGKVTAKRFKSGVEQDKRNLSSLYEDKGYAVMHLLGY